jgi:hypothetical protein
MCLCDLWLPFIKGATINAITNKVPRMIWTAFKEDPVAPLSPWAKLVIWKKPSTNNVAINLLQTDFTMLFIFLEYLKE